MGYKILQKHSKESPKGTEIFKFKRDYMKKVYHRVYETLHSNPSQFMKLGHVFKDFNYLCIQNDVTTSMNITLFKESFSVVLSDDI